MYLEEENTPRIVEVTDDGLGFDLDIKNGLTDPITNGYLLICDG